MTSPNETSDTALTDAEALAALHRTLTETVLPRLHTLRISLEVLAAQLRYEAEDEFPSGPRLVH